MIFSTVLISYERNQDGREFSDRGGCDSGSCSFQAAEK